MSVAVSVLNHWGLLQETLVPAFDHLALANGKGQRLATVVASIKFLAIAGKRPTVMNVDVVSALGFTVSVDLLENLDLEALEMRRHDDCCQSEYYAEYEREQAHWGFAWGRSGHLCI